MLAFMGSEFLVRYITKYPSYVPGNRKNNFSKHLGVYEQNDTENKGINSGAWSKLEQTISMFDKSYHSKLMIISIIPDDEINQRISKICNSNSVYFASNESILKPVNKIKGRGHLNEQGNMLLGKFIYSAFSLH